MEMKRPLSLLLFSLSWGLLLGSCNDRILPADDDIWAGRNIMFTDPHPNPLYGGYGPIVTMPLATAVVDSPSVAWGQLLYPPQGGRIVYSRMDDWGRRSIQLRDLASGLDQEVASDDQMYYRFIDEMAALTFDGNTVAYIIRTYDTGRLYLFVSDGSGDTAALDPDIGDVRGMFFSNDGQFLAVSTIRPGEKENVNIYYQGYPRQRTAVVDNLIPENLLGESFNWYSWMPDNSLLYFGYDPYGVKGKEGLYLAPASGGMPRLIVPGTFSFPTPSPDGSRIAYIRENDLWVMNADGTGQQKIISTLQDEYELIIAPQWSPDGSKIMLFRVIPSTIVTMESVMDIVDIRSKRRKSLRTVLQPGFWLK